MSDASEPMQLADMDALLAHLAVDSIDTAAELISENTEPDAYLQEETGQFVLRMASHGCTLEFPMSVDDFWELVHDLEDQVTGEWNRSSSQGASEVGVHSESDLGRHATDTSLKENRMVWNSPELFPANEPARIARYRRLQSWYRDEVLHAKAGASGNYPALGSYLDKSEVAVNPRLNFLSDEALAHAEMRISQVRAEGGALDPTRLKHNMLSSMPLCFNLFGTMRGEPDFLEVFRELFDPEATTITDVVCEWAPQPSSDFLGDRTAFDAIVFYESKAGPRFCGIETKYTEAFSATEYDSARYAAVTQESGWFKEPAVALVELRGRKTNQLWRNVMLAAAVEAYGQHGTGWVAVVALQEDPGVKDAMGALVPALADAERLKFVPIETILDSADGQPSLERWAADFRQRYVGPLPGGE
ncbi:MAG: hypothetical protein Q8O61_11665 [Nocardioides sp.]|nr:hypothetical protein [Nocardioides sp.]